MHEEFIERFNNYECIKKNDTDDIVELSHYTANSEALINICKGKFRATDIMDFGDKLEGKLILKRVNEIILNLNMFSDNQLKCVNEIIGKDYKINEFINNHRTFVLSMCLDTNCEYLWKNYAKEDGYNIIFNKKRFIDSICFYTQKDEKRDKKYIKHSKIIYDTNEQEKIIEEEIRDLLSIVAFDIGEMKKISLILRHLMYVGNFYKEECRYKEEKEYRVLINTAIPTEKCKEIEQMLPKYCTNDKTGKHYTDLHFDRNSIKTIVCSSENAKKEIEKVITDIPIILKTK